MVTRCQYNTWRSWHCKEEKSTKWNGQLEIEGFFVRNSHSVLDFDGHVMETNACSFLAIVGGHCSFNAKDRSRSVQVVPLLTCNRDHRSSKWSRTITGGSVNLRAAPKCRNLDFPNIVHPWASAGGVLQSTKAAAWASSYEPGRPGWLGFQELASPLFSLQKFRCVHDKAGWPVYRDLGFCDQDLGNRAGNFSHMNTPARIRGLSVTKHFRLRMACKVTILGAFWTFYISVTRLNFPYHQKTKFFPPTGRASPLSGLIWRGPKCSIAVSLSKHEIVIGKKPKQRED